MTQYVQMETKIFGGLPVVVEGQVSSDHHEAEVTKIMWVRGGEFTMKVYDKLTADDLYHLSEELIEHSRRY